MPSTDEVNRLAEAYFFLGAAAVQIEKVVNCWDILDRKAFKHVLEGLQT